MSALASETMSPVGHRSRAEREALVKQWTPLVRSIAKSYFARLGRWYDLEDLIVEGQMALWNATAGYDGSLGLASFKTYAYSAIRHRMHRLAHYWRAKRRRDAIKSVSMDETYEDGEPLRQFATGDLSATEAMEVERDRSVINDALSVMRFREREIIEARFVLGRTLEDVARDHGVSRERIRQVEQMALRKLQHLLRADFPGRVRVGQKPLSYRDSTPVTAHARRERKRRRRQKVASAAGSG